MGKVRKERAAPLFLGEKRREREREREGGKKERGEKRHEGSSAEFQCARHGRLACAPSFCDAFSLCSKTEAETYQRAVPRTKLCLRLKTGSGESRARARGGYETGVFEEQPTEERER